MVAKDVFVLNILFKKVKIKLKLENLIIYSIIKKKLERLPSRSESSKIKANGMD